eukprot:15460079-Alexandrium_andersonii.AAC.1
MAADHCSAKVSRTAFARERPTGPALLARNANRAAWWGGTRPRPLEGATTSSRAPRPQRSS